MKYNRNISIEENNYLEVNQNQNSYLNKSNFKDNYNLVLIWKNITIEVFNSKNSHKKIKKNQNFNIENSQYKTILKDVSGSVKSGELLGILGPSGAGKTSLLNFLSKKIETTYMKSEGEVLLNNIHLSKNDFSSISSYVMQDDILESMMTPKEVLLFTAKLKMTSSVTEHQENKVKLLIKLLKLEKCQNTRIGDNLNRGISGGERKRVSIAVELLSDSPILFLDEPTTGLDSYNAFEVISKLKHLAKSEGKIIIFTIHQPASEIFELLDKISLLSLGRNVYFGSKDGLKDFFKEIQFEIQSKYNPFEHIIEKTSQSAVEEAEVLMKYKELAEIEDKQLRYKEYINIITDVYNKKFFEKEINFHCENSKIPNEVKEMIDNKIKAGFDKEIFYLISRILVITMRNKKTLVMRIFQNIVISIIISIIFSNIINNQTGVRDRIGEINMIALFSIMNAINSNIVLLSEDRKIFLRERGNNLYSPFAYYISKIIGTIPISLIPMCIVTIILYYSTNFNETSGYKLWVFHSILQVGYFSAGLSAFFMGGLANSTEVLVIISTMFNIPLMTLSGYFSPEENFVFYLFPFKYISLFKWVFQLLLINEFTDVGYVCINPPFLCNPLESYKFKESVAVNFIVLASLGIIYCILGYVLVYFKLRNKV